MKYISKLILKMMGWKINGNFPQDIKKCVLIAAPHTSNWDFVIGRAAFYIFGIKGIKFLIKKEFFFFPVGILLKSMGAIPVDRSSKNNTVVKIGHKFDEYNIFRVLITPEGTRSRVKEWKKGFYYIAQHANVPIVLCYVDYGKKEGGIAPFVINPSGNYAKDMEKIEDFYRNITAKYPENFNLTPINAEKN